MSKTAAEIKATDRWNRKTYKTTEVHISIHDRDIIKQYCRQHGLSMSSYFYELAIKDMAAKGIKLQGTATRNVDDIISGGENDDSDGAST